VSRGVTGPDVGEGKRIKCLGRCGKWTAATGLGRCSSCAAALEREAKREARAYIGELRAYAKETGDENATAYADYLEGQERAYARGEMGAGAIPLHLHPGEPFRAWRKARHS
jgi:hypothetical protein